MKKKLLCTLVSLSCILSLTTPALAIDELEPAITNRITESGNDYSGNVTNGFGAHLVKTGNGYFRLENTNKGYDMYGNFVEAGLFLEYYNENFQVTRVDSIPIELEEYIAFYEGEDHYYILFAQSNMEENDSKEVIRVVQYDKNWNRLKATSISNINTVGYRWVNNADMAEVDGNLLIHTNHTMYKLPDGLNHQANLRLVIDIDSMTLLKSASGISQAYTGYVSHSMNQLVDVAADGGVYTADHGDGYPRAMVVFEWPSSSIVGRTSYVETMQIFGATGDNYTGAQLGGLEVSATHALMAGISKPQDGTNQGTYNIFITATDRNHFTNSGTNFKWVTSYAETNDNLRCTNPYLIETSKDEFTLIWTEVRQGQYGQSHTLCWTKVDKAGNLVGSIHRTEGDLSEAKPVLNDDGNLVWYSACFSVPEFCILNLNTNTISTTKATTYRGTLKGTPSRWAEKDLLAAEENDLITEHNRDNFQANITRFQFAELVVNMVEKTTRNSIEIDQSKHFTDTTDTAILKAASAGIVSGVGNNLFKPNDLITREQIASMLSRAIDYIVENGAPNLAPLSGNLNGYIDANEVSRWAVDAVAQMAANGIMKGTSINTLGPQKEATVETCIALINRLYSQI